MKNWRRKKLKWKKTHQATPDVDNSFTGFFSAPSSKNNKDKMNMKKRKKRKKNKMGQVNVLNYYWH